MQRLATHSHRTLPLAQSLLSAGPASEILENFALLDLNALVTKNREGFVAFTITGDSMVPTVQTGNIVFVDTWAEPRNGDIVAAECNGLTCIKIFQNGNKGLYLVSANPEYKPRKITPTDNFRVLGVVKGHLAVY